MLEVIEDSELMLPSAQDIIGSLEDIYIASKQFKALCEVVSSIEVATFTMMDMSVQDTLLDNIQHSLLGFFLEVGNILSASYSFDPFININFHSALCTSTYVPFAVTILFDKPGGIKDLGLLTILFSVSIVDGHLHLQCE